MLDIKKVLFRENVCLDLKARTKDEVIREMVQMLYDNKVIENKEEFIEEIYQRESEGITGIEEGIAIPHGKSKTVNKSVIAVGRTKVDIEDWESFDEKPIRCIIMFAIRDVDVSEHIMLLSQVSEKLLDKDVIKVMHTAQTADEITDVLMREEVE